MNPDYMKVLKGGRAIPGQSLTTNPDEKAPYEKPPQFTNVHAASEYIFEIATETERYGAIMEMLGDGVPLMNVVQTLLFAGFTTGKWNPDLMLLLVEPTAYIILALAERAGLDPTITDGEEEEEAEQDFLINGAAFQKEKLNKLRKAATTDTIPKGVLPKDLMEKLNAVEAPSLMGQETAPVEDASLLAPTPNEEVMQ